MITITHKLQSIYLSWQRQTYIAVRYSPTRWCIYTDDDIFLGEIDRTNMIFTADFAASWPELYVIAAAEIERQQL